MVGVDSEADSSRGGRRYVTSIMPDVIQKKGVRQFGFSGLVLGLATTVSRLQVPSGLNFFQPQANKS